MVDSYDFSLVPPEIAEDMCRQGEIMLQGTVQLAIAADQRAATLTGIFAGGSIALFAAAATVITADSPNWDLACSSIATAILLFMAATIAARAAMPSLFHIAGYEPKRLASSKYDKTLMRQYIGEDIQRRIDFNAAALRVGARNAAYSINVALFSIPFGVALFAALRFAGQ